MGLQTDLAYLNYLVEKTDTPIAVIFEGYDTAGKSSAIRSLTEYLPRGRFRVNESKKPSKSAMASWLTYWEFLMPKNGEKIVFYDRSHYSRALIQAVNQWCTEKQYNNFLEHVQGWEAGLNVKFIKFMLTIPPSEQEFRIIQRSRSPLSYWKLSDNDKKAVSQYDAMQLKIQRLLAMKDWHSVNMESKKEGIAQIAKILVQEMKQKL